MLGLADRGRVMDLFDAILRGDAAGALSELAAQYADGADPEAVLRDLAEITHWVSVIKITPAAAEDPTVSPDERVRGVDMAARVGGEEFAVLLPGASAQQAGAVMERFLHTLGGLDMDIGPHNVRVTATAGVAQQQPGEDLDALMARADTALYAGKQAGRNRVVLAPAPD